MKYRWRARTGSQRASSELRACCLDTKQLDRKHFNPRRTHRSTLHIRHNARRKVCMDVQFWSPSRAQPSPARETELVPAIKDTGFRKVTRLSVLDWPKHAVRGAVQATACTVAPCRICRQACPDWTCVAAQPQGLVRDHQITPALSLPYAHLPMMPSMRARYASSRMTRNTWQPLVADLGLKTGRGDGKGLTQERGGGVGTTGTTR